MAAVYFKILLFPAVGQPDGTNVAHGEDVDPSAGVACLIGGRAKVKGEWHVHRQTHRLEVKICDL